MAKKSAKEYGSEYVGSKLESLFDISGLSTEERAVAKKFLTHDRVAETLGADILRQEDYTRNVQETAQEKTKAQMRKEELDRWAQEQQDKLQQARLVDVFLQKNGLRPEDLLEIDLAALQNNNTTAPDPKLLSTLEKQQKQIETLTHNFNGASAQFAEVMVQLPKLVGQHFARYNEPLDTEALIAHCRERNLPLTRGGYASFVADREKELSDKELQSKLKAAREEGARAEREKLGSGLPYPTSVDGSDGFGNSGIAALLNGTPTSPEIGEDAAVATFMKGMAQRRVG